MQSEAFMAGVIPGAPNTDYEVRILICWLLRGDRHAGHAGTAQYGVDGGGAGQLF